jgi:hypothetical protein
MIVGLLVVLGLAVVGGRTGLAVGNWWIDREMPNAELEGIVPVFAATVLGAAAGIGIGLGIAYALGRREGR